MTFESAVGEAQLCGEMGLISKQTQEQTSGGPWTVDSQMLSQMDKVATETDRQSHIWKDKQWMNKGGKLNVWKDRWTTNPTVGGTRQGRPGRDAG